MNASPLRRSLFVFTLGLALAPLRSDSAPRVTPLDLAPAANTRFSDERPDDRQGGWIDQGGNDLHVMPSGALTLAGVPVTVLAEREPTSKTCIVLGGSARPALPAAAELPVPSLRGSYLYLLHAAAWCPAADAKNNMTGALTIEYADGAKAEQHVRFGRDVGDWASPDSYKNAARAWTSYNGNTQVSLFLSRFKLKPQPVKAVRFEARDSAWMVVAASLGDEVALVPLKADLTLDKTYTAPAFDPALAAAAPAAAAPKNVILIIGDGMGPGALQLTSLYQHKAEGRLYLEHLPVAGLCTTHSGSAPVTDSAAASTAFACGHKTRNGMIGLLPDERRVASFAELAKQSGRAVGLITSDAITGATPAGFYAHVSARGSYGDVAVWAAACGFDLLAGNANGKAWFAPKAAGGQRADSRNLLTEMAAAGYALSESPAGFAATPAEKRPLGFMAKGTLDSETCLAELTQAALARLSKNEKGFFLMTECTITDAGGHGNKPELTVRGTLQVDWATKAAAEFARGRGDTLVLVTADHETGGLSSFVTNTPPGKLVIRYTTTSHTANPVKLFAYGPGASAFGGTLDNTDIAKRLAAFWSLTLDAPAKKTQP